MSLTIEIANVGPIRHARLSLGRLNVLIGENDTGKTFFATVVHRLFASQSDAYFPSRTLGESIPDNVIDRVEHIEASLGREDGRATDLDSLIDDDTRAWVNDINTSTLQRYGQALRRKIAYAYGLPIERLRRQPVSYSIHESCIFIENLDPQWCITIPMDEDLECSVTCPIPTIGFVPCSVLKLSSGLRHTLRRVGRSKETMTLVPGNAYVSYAGRSSTSKEIQRCFAAGPTSASIYLPSAAASCRVTAPSQAQHLARYPLPESSLSRSSP